MIVTKSDVKMWTQKVTNISHEHTIWNERNGTRALRGKEETFASEYLANFDAKHVDKIDFSGVKKLMASLEATAEKNAGTFDASGSLRLKLLLLWMLLLRLFSSDDEQKNIPEQKRSLWDMVTGSGGAKAGNLPPIAPRSAAPGSTALSGNSSLQGETEVKTREWLFFEAHGTVSTREGKDIPIDIRLRLTDDQKVKMNLDHDAARSLIDPLVVNYGHDSVELTDQKFSFDLDADGVPEGIAVPASGCAFLALDRNGDGIINDGSELFGVKLGDGFAELAQFDDDKNGFIDEGDRIYEQLCLFTKDAEGNDVVFSLRDKGVKAISLENLATSLRLSEGAGQLRRTGFIVRANGTASTVQHVDLRPEPVTTSQNKIPSVMADYAI